MCGTEICAFVTSLYEPSCCFMKVCEQTRSPWIHITHCPLFLHLLPKLFSKNKAVASHFIVKVLELEI